METPDPAYYAPRYGYPEETILDQAGTLPESGLDIARADQDVLGTSYGLPRYAMCPELPFPFNHIESAASNAELLTKAFFHKAGQYLTTRVPEILSWLRTPKKQIGRAAVALYQTESAAAA